MKIYTKTGDKGETGLFGGDRVSKDSLRIEAYGTIDELNSFIGLAAVEVRDKEVAELLQRLQNELFTVGADLSTPDNEKTRKYREGSAKHTLPQVSADFYARAEQSIDHFEAKLEELKNFILPGGTKSAALLHICRTICRRAERRVVALKKTENISDNIIIYLNRLSDLFFVLSRIENAGAGVPDVIWIPAKH